MAITFPSNPNTNDTFTYNTVIWTYDGNKWRKGSAGGGATVTSSTTVPATTTQGSLWFDTDQGDLSVYSGTGWLTVGDGGGSGGSGGTGTNQGAENVARAPRTLIETTRNFQQSTIARDWLGDTFVDHFAATREWEWRQWLDGVTDWELKRYFEII